MREKRAFPSRLGSAVAARAARLLAATLVLWGCSKGSSAPSAACTLDYGGESQTVLVQPTSDPYHVQPHRVDDRFEFKAVYVTTPADVAVLDLYTYFVFDRGPVILEQTKYRPPFPRNNAGPGGTFTGDHYVYGPAGQELRYSCRWQAP
jgi:hypothetical protein